MDEDTLDRVRAYASAEPYKKALRKRSVWVEPLEASGKQWHETLSLTAPVAGQLRGVHDCGWVKSQTTAQNGVGDGVRAQQRPYVPSFWLFLGGRLVLFWRTGLFPQRLAQITQ